MEFLGLILVVIVLAVGVGGILGIIAFIKVKANDHKIRAAQEQIRKLRIQISGASPEPPPARPSPPAQPEPAGPEPIKPEPAKPAAVPPPLPKKEVVEPVRVPVPESSLLSAREAASVSQKETWERFEQVVGKMWMSWVGALVLFLAAGFFVKYAIDHNWIGPTARVLMGIVMGVALLIVGDRFLRKPMRALGQSLIGGGLAVLYVSLFASFSLYHLVPQAAAFGAMVLVTVAGMTLSVLHNAMAISFLAVLGGMITPVLLSTGTNARDTLFAYLTVLDLGVLGVALFKRWRALDILAFAGTVVLFIGWFDRYYAEAAMVPTMLWLGGFYLIFLMLPFGYHLRLGTSIDVERFVMSMINAVLVFTCAYVILNDNYRHVLGFVSLGMAGSYMILGAQTRKSIPSDARGLFGFIALAVSFLTLAVPLHLKLHGITLAWAIEAPVLLYLGYRYRYLPVRVASFIILIFAGFRVFAVHWPLHEALFTPILNKSFGSAMFVPLCAAAFTVIHHWWKSEEAEGDRTLKVTAAVGAGFLALLFLQSEIGSWLSYLGADYASAYVTALLWAAGSALFLAAGIRLRSLAARIAGLVPLLIAVVLAMALYEDQEPIRHILFLNMRCIAGLAAAGTLFAYGLTIRRFREICAEGEQALASFLLWSGALVLLIMLSLEAYAFSLRVIEDGRTSRWVARMSLSIVWGVYAASMLIIGFWKQARSLRLAALGLFGVTVLKLAFFDIAGIQQIYRIISFFVLGLLMIAAAYLYNRVEKRLEETLGGKTP
ncbi:DUF2339 domain-containing protein [Planctomycetota bacterium]